MTLNSNDLCFWCEIGFCEYIGLCVEIIGKEGNGGEESYIFPVHVSTGTVGF